jgi:hypothetical protein
MEAHPQWDIIRNGETILLKAILTDVVINTVQYSEIKASDAPTSNCTHHFESCSQHSLTGSVLWSGNMDDDEERRARCVSL